MSNSWFSFDCACTRKLKPQDTHTQYKWTTYKNPNANWFGSIWYNGLELPSPLNIFMILFSYYFSSSFSFIFEFDGSPWGRRRRRWWWWRRKWVQDSDEWFVSVSVIVLMLTSLSIRFVSFSLTVSMPIAYATIVLSGFCCLFVSFFYIALWHKLNRHTFNVIIYFHAQHSCFTSSLFNSAMRSIVS